MRFGNAFKYALIIDYALIVRAERMFLFLVCYNVISQLRGVLNFEMEIRLNNLKNTYRNNEIGMFHSFNIHLLHGVQQETANHICT